MSHGGKRFGAGRPKGQNAYGEPTKPLRIPMSRVDAVKAFLLDENATPLSLPLYSSTVRAGFPSPADDYIECQLDLNEYLIQHPNSTFLVKASGDSMRGAGIQSGDILVVDKSLQPSHGRIVIAALDGELTVKRLHLHEGRLSLVAENPHYPPLDITHEQDLVIWGVVTHVIHEAK